MGTRSLTDAARAALRNGNEATATALCRDALAQDDRDAVAWTLLGTALRRCDPVAAEEALRRALAVDADAVDARFHLGNLLRERDRHAEAVDAYREALRRAPDHPSVLNNLGLSLAAIGANDEAERAWHAALDRQPAHSQALANLVHLLCRRHRHAETVHLAERYLSQHRQAPADLWIDYGIARHARGDYDAAAACFRRALAAAPADPTALSNLATALVDMRRFDEAAVVLAKAREAAPADLYVAGLLAHCDAHRARWDGIDALHASIARGLEHEPKAGINPFHALAMPLSPALQQQCARHWAAAIALPGAAAAAPAVIGERGTRLRLGYVSSDFREHALAYLATEVFERHDRRRVATFGYAIGAPDASSMRRRIEAAFETFRDCAAEEAQRVAQRIRDDAIDVLVDLNGYTTHARSEILSARPARVQMQWLGFLGTMGAPWIDGVITDRHAAPPELQRHFDERFLYLPDCYCPSDSRRPVASDAGNRMRHGLPERGVVLCCFNETYKLLPSVFDVWMRLLRSVPRAVLWLSPSSATAVKHLRREAAARGVDASRLVIAERVPLDAHLARHAHADLYLDTTPYNAGTAANDALFMGVPVLTCSGETMASRVAGSQLHAIGLADFVTHDLAEYEQRALSLAREPDALREARARLAQNRTRYPLFDMVRFTSALEDVLVCAAAGN